jgi:hypothetical protein
MRAGYLNDALSLNMREPICQQGWQVQRDMICSGKRDPEILFVLLAAMQHLFADFKSVLA